MRPVGRGISGEEELALSIEASFDGGARAVSEVVVRTVFEPVVSAMLEHAEGRESARLAAAVDTDSGTMSEYIDAAGVVTDAITCDVGVADVTVAKEPTEVAIALVKAEGIVVELDGEGAREAPKVPSVLVIFAKGASVGDDPGDMGWTAPTSRAGPGTP